MSAHRKQPRFAWSLVYSLSLALDILGHLGIMACASFVGRLIVCTQEATTFCAWSLSLAFEHTLVSNVWSQYVNSLVHFCIWAFEQCACARSSLVTLVI